MVNEYFTRLVIARLKTVPPNVDFSFGEYGDFTRDQLIQEVEKNTEVGKETIKMEINFIYEMPKLAKRLKTNE